MRVSIDAYKRAYPHTLVQCASRFCTTRSTARRMTPSISPKQQATSLSASRSVSTTQFRFSRVFFPVFKVHVAGYPALGQAHLQASFQRERHPLRPAHLVQLKERQAGRQRHPCGMPPRQQHVPTDILHAHTCESIVHYLGQIFQSLHFFGFSNRQWIYLCHLYTSARTRTSFSRHGLACVCAYTCT
jgi:hypothetical protein